MRIVTTIKTIEQMIEYEVPDEVFQRAIDNGTDGLYAYLCQDSVVGSMLSQQEIDEKIIGPGALKLF